MSTVVAWTMQDGDYKYTHLLVHLMLVDNYFMVGTEWPDEEIGWFTRSLTNVDEACTFAVHHTGMLEKTGDVMTRGPFALAIEGKEQTSRLEELVEKDQPSAFLDYLFSMVILSTVSE